MESGMSGVMMGIRSSIVYEIIISYMFKQLDIYVDLQNDCHCSLPYGKIIIIIYV